MNYLEKVGIIGKDLIVGNIYKPCHISRGFEGGMLLQKSGFKTIWLTKNGVEEKLGLDFSLFYEQILTEEKIIHGTR
jgi:hypothetical protein